MESIYEEIKTERKRQNELYGEQNLPMVRVPEYRSQYKELADTMKEENKNPEKQDWCSILVEEVYEAFAEKKPEKQREEMVQVAAVAIQIIEYLDRKIQSRNLR